MEVLHVSSIPFIRESLRSCLGGNAMVAACGIVGSEWSRT